jgi:hypothetical protein
MRDLQTNLHAYEYKITPFFFTIRSEISFTLGKEKSCDRYF